MNEKLNKITDVIIHTDNELNDQQLKKLSEKVRHHEGVISLRRNRRTPKFLMLVYDAAKIRSKNILNTVTSQGYNATLVGI